MIFCNYAPYGGLAWSSSVMCLVLARCNGRIAHIAAVQQPYHTINTWGCVPGCQHRGAKLLFSQTSTCKKSHIQISRIAIAHVHCCARDHTAIKHQCSRAPTQKYGSRTIASTINAAMGREIVRLVSDGRSSTAHYLPSRPRTVEDVAHQEEVVKTLQKALHTANVRLLPT